MKAAIAVVAAVLALTVGAIVLLGPGDGPSGPDEPPLSFSTTTSLGDADQAVKDRATAWSDGVAAAVGPLGDVLPDLETAPVAWQGGELPDADLAASLDSWEETVTGVRTALDGIEPLEGAPEAIEAYRTSIDLYAETIRSHRSALDLADGELQDQVTTLARRLLLLADKVFDRGRAFVAPLLFESEDPRVVVRLREEVPAWPSEQRAAGPPLTDPPPVVPEAGLFPDREVERPTQPRSAWLEAVREAGAPDLGAVTAALEGEDPVALDTVADRLIDAVEALREVPDPAGEGGREESARLRLGLLVHADAARAAQAALLAAPEAPELAAIADRLADLGAAPVLGVTTILGT